MEIMNNKIDRVGRISGDADFIAKRLNDGSINKTDALKELVTLEHELSSITCNKEEENVMELIELVKAEIKIIKASIN